MRLSQVWSFAAVSTAVALGASGRLGALDLAYHLRAGAEMVAARRVMMVDSFTFTANGSPWLNQQWLAQIVMAAVHGSCGWFGLASLRAAMVAAVAWFLLDTCREVGADRRTAAWLTIVAAPVMMWTLGLRPQLFGVLCFAISLWVLSRRARQPRLTWLLVPVALLWANLHGSFVLLFVVGGAAVLDDLRERTPLARPLFIVGIAALLATLANPWGVDVWRYAIAMGSNPLLRVAVSEWHAPTFRSFPGAAFLVSVPPVAWAVIRSRRRLGWPQLLALAGFLAIGLTALRGAPWWAMFAAVTVAQVVPRRTGQPDDPPRRLNVAVASAFAIPLVILLGRWVPYRTPGFVPAHLLETAPVAITTSLQGVLRPGDRVFAAQGWGSWIEFALPANPVAVDTRIELFDREVWVRYATVTDGNDGWREILDDWNVRALAVHAGQQPALLEQLTGDPVWQLVFRTDEGAVFLRRRVSG